MRFLSSVNEGVGLQIVVSAKRLVALWTIVFDPTVRLLVTEKVAPSRKCLLTQVASYLVLHHQLSPPPLMGDPFLLLKTAIHHFPFPTILKCLTIGHKINHKANLRVVAANSLADFHFHSILKCLIDYLFLSTQHYITRQT